MSALLYIQLFHLFQTNKCFYYFINFFYTSLVPWCPLPLCWGAKKETVLTLVFCFALYWLERVMMLTVFVDMQQEKQHSQMKHERFALFSRRKMRLVAWAGLSLRAGGRGFSPATKRVAPGYFYWKIEPKEIPSRLIPRLLVVFTWQLEILVTTLLRNNVYVAVNFFSQVIFVFLSFLGICMQMKLKQRKNKN